MTMNQDQKAVEHLLGRYFDALYHGDVGELSELLHPSAIYATASGGQLLRLDMPSYFDAVARREKPAATNAPREESISSVEFVGGTMARAEVRCCLFGRDYVDFLTLLKIDGRWWIFAKLFHYSERTI